MRFDTHLYGSDEAYPKGGQAQVVRGSDGQYWNGTAWQAGQTWNATDIAANGLSHSYDFPIPADANDSDRFILTIRITNDPASEELVNLVVLLDFTPNDVAPTARFH